jgi:hypothetical protein
VNVQLDAVNDDVASAGENVRVNGEAIIIYGNKLFF